MNVTRHLRPSIIALALAATPAGVAQQPAATRPAELPPPSAKIEVTSPDQKTMPLVRIGSAPLSVAIEQLGQSLRAADIPEPNIIFSPESRELIVPDLTLRNVNGNDALRLITVSAGCDMDPILGTDNHVVGFRISTPGGAGGFGGAAAADGGMAGALPGAGRFVGAQSTPPRLEQAPGLPGVPPPALPPAGDPFAISGIPGAPTISPPLRADAPTVMGFGMMPGHASTSVRVYNLGGITNTVKFTDVETTLRDILQAGGVSSEHAKLAFHEKTNVLVVNGNPQAHELATQFIDALQKNVTAAAAQNRQLAAERSELTEMSVRLRAEEEQRAKLSLQLEKTESLLRESQRELDRLRATAKQSQ